MEECRLSLPHPQGPRQPCFTPNYSRSSNKAEKPVVTALGLGCALHLLISMEAEVLGLILELALLQNCKAQTHSRGQMAAVRLPWPTGSHRLEAAPGQAWLGRESIVREQNCKPVLTCVNSTQRPWLSDSFKNLTWLGGFSACHTSSKACVWIHSADINAL